MSGTIRSQWEKRFNRIKHTICHCSVERGDLNIVDPSSIYRDCRQTIMIESYYAVTYLILAGMKNSLDVSSIRTSEKPVFMSTLDLYLSTFPLSIRFTLRVSDAYSLMLHNLLLSPVIQSSDLASFCKLTTPTR